MSKSSQKRIAVLKEARDEALKDFWHMAKEHDGKIVDFRNCGVMFLYFMELYDKGLRYKDI